MSRGVIVVMMVVVLAMLVVMVVIVSMMSVIMRRMIVSGMLVDRGFRRRLAATLVGPAFGIERRFNVENPGA